MSTITFYRQARQDGAVRTGIEIDRNTVLARFDASDSEADPALVWYVDVECTGKSLPDDSDGARNWLLSHEQAIAKGLNDLANEAAVGTDADAWPLQRTLRAGRGIQVRIKCSAVRRLEGREIAAVLKDIAAQWKSRVGQMRAI